MRVLLVGLNSKYLHSCPAIYILKKNCQLDNIEIITKEWNINDKPRNILGAIYHCQPDLIGFSCSIWNVQFLTELMSDVRRILPKAFLVWGGPQVKGIAGKLLANIPQLDCVIQGEGENSFPQVVAAVAQHSSLAAIAGVFSRDGEDIVGQVNNEVLDLSQLPFLYSGEDLQALTGKIIYYESSRGCPYHCSFCCSGNEPLRFRDLALVKADLAQLLQLEKAQIKFVDRTFNADSHRAVEIMTFLIEHYNPHLSWHFEISPYALTAEFLAVVAQAPTGYFKLEAGLQTIYAPTLEAINRHGDWKKAQANLEQILAVDNVSVHLDLIAGLPYEDLQQFSQGFNLVHQWNSHYLQLGFLKVLPGSQMVNQCQQYGILYSDYPPYEVLATKWLPFADVIILQNVDKALDAFYNSGFFRQTLLVAGLRWQGGAMEFYRDLWQAKEKFSDGALSTLNKFGVLLHLLQEKEPADSELWLDLLRLDYLLYGKGERMPVFLRRQEDVPDQQRKYFFKYTFQLQENNIFSWHLQDNYLVFDHQAKSGVTQRAAVREI